MLPLTVKGLRLSLLSIMLGSTIGCSQLFPFRLTQISELQKQQSHGTTVYVKGRVRQQAPLYKSGAYQLQDTTGKIWVITEKSLPQEGDEITIKGRLKYQSIPLGEKELREVYIQEIKQLESRADLQAQTWDQFTP